MCPLGLTEIGEGTKDTKDWSGYRSSRLNRQYRVIYKINNDEVYVLVEQISPHDYRRK
ncbi:MAG: hypothetical protein JSS37_00290 [Proteobacteria bacterium]|nr:hypothetical protein [Pseudomonadota bacterium]